MTPTDSLAALGRTVACRRCGAFAGLDCMAPTGLQASDRCPVRLDDAQWATRLVTA